MIPHRSLSRATSENGVSSRVEACRKRLRTVRVNQKGSIETVEAAVFLACNVGAGAEISGSSGVIETIAERLDEAGKT